jgi:pimeloyl-ACP methyl ester carboxylesterase
VTNKAVTLADEGFLDLAPLRLEYRMIGPRPGAAPTIVMLHEGLGSAGLWGTFPDDIATATGCGVFVYSRSGYGKSSPAKLPRTTEFLNEEACEVLPRVLDAIGFRRGFLLGHSDGASIAAIYAGSVQDHRVRGVVLIAPHFFIEEKGINEIRRAKKSYESGALRARLEPFHADVDAAFYSWNVPWLDPAFQTWDITEVLGYIRVPMLIMQGEDDQYGTLEQVAVARRECYCPVEIAILPGVRHIPYRDAPGLAVQTVADFINRLLRDHHEGETPAMPGLASS